MPTRKWGPEKLVNTTTTGFQGSSDVAALTGGGFVVVWEDESAGGDAAIRAQRYDATGKPVGAEMVIANGPGAETLPSVTGLANGGFYVTWTLDTGPNSNEIRGSVYDANGVFVRSQPVIFATGNDDNSDVAKLGTGSVVVWEDPDTNGIDFRIFSAAGTGGSILVANFPLVNIEFSNPAVAAAPNGATFAIVWADSEGSASNIEVRVFDASGTPLTDPIGVDFVDPGVLSDPVVTWLNNGQFVVAWTESISTTDIKMQVFEVQSGSVVPLTGEILVNSTTASFQGVPTITALPSGGFVIAWQDSSGVGLDGDLAIRLQAFDAAGGKIGGEIVVNTTTSSVQNFPSITALADGRVVVSWTDNSSVADIRMQIIDPRDGIVTGTPNAETLYGHAAVADEISGGAGNDTLLGLGGNDSLYGGEGNDTLTGGSGDDLVFGDAGNDTIVAGVGLGDDEYDGGTGTDTITFSSTTQSVTVNLSAAANQATGAQIGTDQIANAENVIGGSGNDMIAGNSANNQVSGLAGNDTLTGFGGDDRLDGGTGVDAMAGGNGNDTYVVETVGDTASESSGSGTDLVQSAISFTLASGVENLTLTGSSAINAGGNSAANILVGNGAANRLRGFAGNDTLTGGGGPDVFVFDDGDGSDIVTDFQNGSDKFDLTLVAGVDAFADLTVIDNGATVTVSYGTGGFTIGNVGDPTLIDASDFVFA